MLRRDVIAGAAAFGTAGGAPAPPARRVASLNPCLDAMLVALADPSQIAALSHYSRTEGSSSVPLDIARRYPVVYETAEEILTLGPDLVLASRHSSLATRKALARLGIPVLLFATPATIAESLAQMRQVAAALGRDARGRAVIASIKAALADAPPPRASAVTALVFQRNGFSSGVDTLMNELLQRTGFTNAITRYGLTRTSNVPLESLIADPPQVLLRGTLRPGYPGWGERVMDHPALRAIGPRMRIVDFPERLMFCGGTNLIEAAGLLTDAHRKVARHR